jgi:CBS domain containing-hemolysin-like protein
VGDVLVNAWLALAIGLLLLGFNAFFVGAEFALISARRSTIEPRAQEGSRRAKTALRAMENISLMLAGAQLGITICSLLLLAVVEPAVAHLLQTPFDAIGIPEGLVHPIGFVIALAVVGLAHVVLGEMVPKNIALAGPERAALVLAGPLVLLVRVLAPAVRALNWIANRLLTLAGVHVRDEVASAFTRDEVAGLVAESRREGLLDPMEERLLVGALKFEERDARAVLLAADRLETLPVTVTPAQVEQAAARTGFSRFPVRGEDGSLIGYLHLKDALEIKDVHRSRPIARGWIRPLPTVTLRSPLRAVLATMQRSGAHMAEAVDDEGVAQGVVALEDVLEEIVGEVRDESRAGAARR